MSDAPAKRRTGAASARRQSYDPPQRPRQRARGRLRWRLLRLVAVAGAAGGVLGLAAFWGLTLYLEDQLPPVLSVAQYRAHAPQLSRVFGAEGRTIGVLRTERRTLVRLESLPAHVKDALIAAEDADFYRHAGLDWLGMARAMIVNLRDGRMSQGASTITQQLARSLSLTHRKTLERKLIEVFLARKLERRLTKEEILEIYLNQVYFGDGRWGIEEAARHYFGKPASRLTLGEAASMMAVLPAPERLNPYADLPANLRRRARILEAMVRHGLATSDAVTAANHAPLRMAVRRMEDPSLAPWFMDGVRRRLAEVLPADAIRRGGLRIYTGLRRELQGALDRAVAGGLDADDGAEAAAVFIDATTREVVAIVGGRDRSRSEFNRGILAQRQAGSTFKPFVFGAGFEAGSFDESSSWPNKRLSFRGRVGRWRPRNASGRHDGRRVRPGEALAKSLNVIAIQALQDVGVPRVVDFARRAGLRHTIPADLTAALGSGVVTPLELANAFATFAADGRAGEPVWIRRIEDADGRLLFAGDAQLREVMRPSIARRVQKLLRRVVQSGTGRRAQVEEVGDDGKEIVVAGKTGTTNRSRDAWFVGSARVGGAHLTGAVWVGFDNNAPMPGRGGGATAAPIFAKAIGGSLARAAGR